MFMTTIIYILECICVQENLFGHLQNIIKEWNYQHESANNHLKNNICQRFKETKGDNQKTCKKSLKIPKGQSEYVYRRRTENAMAKRKNTKGQTTIYKTYI